MNKMKQQDDASSPASKREQYLPHLTVDCVVFGFHGGGLQVLLLKWKHIERWSLPGGPIQRSEAIDAAARRILQQRTGLDEVFLRQIHVFGDMDRVESILQPVVQKELGTDALATWLLDRVVSVGYYALVDYLEVIPTHDTMSVECRWWDLHKRPPLLLDHEDMVAKALLTLQLQLRYQPVGLNLLPEKFTMPELQTLYESILGKTLDRRNFRKKMLDLGIIERLHERRIGSAHRSPYLYRFKIEQYEEVLANGITLDFKSRTCIKVDISIRFLYFFTKKHTIPGSVTRLFI